MLRAIQELYSLTSFFIVGDKSNITLQFYLIICPPLCFHFLAADSYKKIYLRHSVQKKLSQSDRTLSWDINPLSKHTSLFISGKLNNSPSTVQKHSSLITVPLLIGTRGCHPPFLQMQFFFSKTHVVNTHSSN